MTTSQSIALTLAALTWLGAGASAQTPVIRVGIIGTDTSHVTAFTRLLNDANDPNHVPGARVVAAFKAGSPDVEASRTRIDKFAAELRDRWSVEFVDSIEQLTQRVDAVLLESVEGRPHLEQVRPVLKAGKRVFIDKPLTASYADAREIVRLSRESGVPFFSSSSLRFAADVQAIRNSDKHDGICGAFYGPENLEPPCDLFWYGIHAVEMRARFWNRPSRSRDQGDPATPSSGDRTAASSTCAGLIEGGRERRRRVRSEGGAATPVCEDRLPGACQDRQVLPDGRSRRFRRRTLEIIAFMEAAGLSKVRGGAPVMLGDVTRPPR